MEKKALRVQDYIEHILGANGRIESYVHDLDQAAFERNTLVQDAVIRNFEIIGEAADKRLDLAYRIHDMQHRPERLAGAGGTRFPADRGNRLFLRTNLPRVRFGAEKSPIFLSEK